MHRTEGNLNLLVNGLVGLAEGLVERIARAGRKRSTQRVRVKGKVIRGRVSRIEQGFRQQRFLVLERFFHFDLLEAAGQLGDIVLKAGLGNFLDRISRVVPARRTALHHLRNTVFRNFDGGNKIGDFLDAFRLLKWRRFARSAAFWRLFVRSPEASVQVAPRLQVGGGNEGQLVLEMRGMFLDEPLRDDRVDKRYDSIVDSGIVLFDLQLVSSVNISWKSLK